MPGWASHRALSRLLSIQSLPISINFLSLFNYPVHIIPVSTGLSASTLRQTLTSFRLSKYYLKTIMSSPLDTLDITILRRDKNGKPDHIFPSNGYTAQQVMASVNLARSLIAGPRGQPAFTRLCAGTLANTQMETWWGDMTENDLAKSFIHQVVAMFPPIFVDCSFAHPDHAACTHRKAYEGDFDPLQHAITISEPVSSRWFHCQSYSPPS